MTDRLLSVTVVPVTPFQQNCSVLRCGRTGRGAIVDPGGEIDRIMEAAGEMDASIEKILVTHGHLDHVGAVDALSKQLGVPVEGPHREDRFWIDALVEQGRMFGFPASTPFTPDRWLVEGDVVQFGEVRMDVHHCPGHTPGHIIFFHPPSRLAIVGDVLFRGSIGRTDFPRGNYQDLIGSIRGRLFPLGDDVQFIPGHGPTSTIGHERRTNPFVADDVVLQRP